MRPNAWMPPPPAQQAARIPNDDVTNPQFRTVRKTYPHQYSERASRPLPRKPDCRTATNHRRTASPNGTRYWTACSLGGDGAVDGSETADLADVRRGAESTSETSMPSGVGTVTGLEHCVQAMTIPAPRGSMESLFPQCGHSKTMSVSGTWSLSSSSKETAGAPCLQNAETPETSEPLDGHLFIVLFPFLGLRKAERDGAKKRPLPVSLLQAPENGLAENTKRGPRVLRAFSLARVVQRIFSGFGANDDLQKADVVAGCYWVAGGVGVMRGGAPRGKEEGSRKRLPGQALSAGCWRGRPRQARPFRLDQPAESDLAS